MAEDRCRPTWRDTWLAMAVTVGRRSRCDRRRVGAIIVTADNQVAAASYNGTPARMRVEGTCSDWCERAQGTKLTGACTPPVPLEPAEGDLSTDMLDYRRCPMIHAEANALLRADRSRITGGTLYVSSAVCVDCAKLVANSGLTAVVMCLDPVRDAHRQPQVAIGYLTRCGIAVITRGKEGP